MIALIWFMIAMILPILKVIGAISFSWVLVLSPIWVYLLLSFVVSLMTSGHLPR